MLSRLQSRQEIGRQRRARGGDDDIFERLLVAPLIVVLRPILIALRLIRSVFSLALFAWTWRAGGARREHIARRNFKIAVVDDAGAAQRAGRARDAARKQRRTQGNDAEFGRDRDKGRDRVIRNQDGREARARRRNFLWPDTRRRDVAGRDVRKIEMEGETVEQRVWRTLICVMAFIQRDDADAGLVESRKAVARKLDPARIQRGDDARRS